MEVIFFLFGVEVEWAKLGLGRCSRGLTVRTWKSKVSVSDGRWTRATRAKGGRLLGELWQLAAAGSFRVAGWQLANGLNKGREANASRKEGRGTSKRGGSSGKGVWRVSVCAFQVRGGQDGHSKGRPKGSF